MRIAHAKRMTSKKWQDIEMSWGEFIKYQNEPHNIEMTRAAFDKLSKEEQLKIKDVGGYVAGVLKDGVRNSSSLISRSMLTLDADDIKDLDGLMFSLNMTIETYLVHSTLKHTEEKPRIRVLIPLTREVSPVEYEAVARKVADTLGLDNFDKTTFQPDRLMFWSAKLSDQPFVCTFTHGNHLNPDEWLALYKDYTDVTEWARHGGLVIPVNDTVEDPTTKDGIIGIFCRHYDIHTVIEQFLSKFYTKGKDGRYTYTGGTSANGLWVSEDGLFAYSHHGTDPANTGHAQNAFDLCRIHLFEGDIAKMYSFAAEQPAIRTEMQLVRAKESEEVFNAFEAAEITDRLTYDKNGNIDSTQQNCVMILTGDEKLKGLYGYDEFTNNYMVFSRPPWAKDSNYPRNFQNEDMELLKLYFGVTYGITKERFIEQAYNFVVANVTRNTLKERIMSLPKWDGVARLDTWLIDYFGVEDNIYTREAGRITLFGAIARGLKPATKFDYVLTFIGAQGIGKSTILEKFSLGMKPVVLNTFETKDAKSQLIGSWFTEIPELSAIRKSDLETVKAFLTATTDKFRPAYARSDREYNRSAIFIATTNDETFLQDITGNRRFLPVRCTVTSYKDRVCNLTEDIARLIMSEARDRYLNEDGDNLNKLVLSEEANVIADINRDASVDIDERVETIEHYLSLEIPHNFEDMSIAERQIFYKDCIGAGTGLYRNYISGKEVFIEMFGGDSLKFDRRQQHAIGRLLKSLKGFEKAKHPTDTKLFGKQRYYVRKENRDIFF